MIKRIEIKGAYGETNFGDDLLMCVLECFLLRNFKSVELNFVGKDDKYVSKFLSNSFYREPGFKPDLIVYGGGTQFFSFSAPKKSNKLQKVFFILKNPVTFFKKVVFSRDENNSRVIPSSFLGFGIGPFYYEGGVKEQAKKSISTAVFVGVRDEVSHSYCKEWGIKAFLGADVVFSSYFNLPSLSKPKNDRVRVGVIVRDWNWEQSGADYIEELKSVHQQSGLNVSFQFIVLAPLKDRMWMQYLKNKNALIWNPENYSINDFLKELNGFDSFITARYHGAIIGCLLSKPVVCIEIEDKLKILTQQIPELKLWNKPFNKEELVDHLLTLDFQVDYTNSLKELKIKAEQMFNLFVEQVKIL